MADPGRPRPRRGWSAQQRLDFIEFRLRWQGTLNRRDLREQFGISQPQASADIAAYQELAPGNCEYNGSEKMYVAGDGFEPVLGRATPEIYLNELRSVASGIKRREESWIGRLPSYSTIPLPEQPVDETVLVNVLESAAVGTSLCLLYQSSNSREAEWRWLAPHAFGHDGQRWYARAFCYSQRAFDDFSLGRLLRFGDAYLEGVDPTMDREWEEEISLELGTHPELPDDRVAAVAFDYQMVDGRSRIAVKAAAVPHFLRSIRADLDPKTTRWEQSPVVLANRDEVEANRQALRADSARLLEEADVVDIPGELYEDLSD